MAYSCGGCPFFFVGGCKGGKPCPENNPPIEVGLLRSWLQQFGDGLVGVPFPMVPPSIVTLLRFAKEFDRLGRERDAMLAKMGHPVGFGDKMPGRSFFYYQALGQRAPLQQVVGPVPWSCFECLYFNAATTCFTGLRCMLPLVIMRICFSSLWDSHFEAHAFVASSTPSADRMGVSINGGTSQ